MIDYLEGDIDKSFSDEEVMIRIDRIIVISRIAYD